MLQPAPAAPVHPLRRPGRRLGRGTGGTRRRADDRGEPAREP